MENNLKQTLQECNTVCAELSLLLKEENESLQNKRDIKIIDANLKEKKQLTLKLEKCINIIKTNFEAIRTNAEMLKDLSVFKRLIDGYKQLVSKNMLLLRAAHSATSIILESIHKQTQKPAIKTYTANGYGKETIEKGPSLINYSI